MSPLDTLGEKNFASWSTRDPTLILNCTSRSRNGRTSCLSQLKRFMLLTSKLLKKVRCYKIPMIESLKPLVTDTKEQRSFNSLRVLTSVNWKPSSQRKTLDCTPYWKWGKESLFRRKRHLKRFLAEQVSLTLWESYHLSNKLVYRLTAEGISKKLSKLISISWMRQDMR